MSGTPLFLEQRDKLLLNWFALLIPPVVFMGCLDSAFYYPDRVHYDTPSRLGLAFRNLSFASSDGTRLSGWFIPANGYEHPKDAK